MSPNRELSHVLILPEDDRDRQLANGFHLQIAWNLQRQMQVLPVAGGWVDVLNIFESEHVPEMDRWNRRFMVLLIDFDGTQNRLQNAKARIPERLTDRVFVLGALSTPEALRAATARSYEDIGKTMAEDCRQGINGIWQHELLRHNAAELDRLRRHVYPILFE